MDLFLTAELLEISTTAYYYEDLDPALPRIKTEVRHPMCINFVDCALCCLCPHYHCPIFSLKLRCGKMAVSWKPRSYIGAHVWLVVPQNRKSHFAQETAFAISITHEFLVKNTEQELEIRRVFIRKDKFANIHPTVSRALLAALDRTKISQLQPGLVIGQLGDARVYASNEFCLRDTTERTAFIGALDGIVR